MLLGDYRPVTASLHTVNTAIADNSELIPFLEPDIKSAIRLVALVAVIVLRPIKQKSLA